MSPRLQSELSLRVDYVVREAYIVGSEITGRRNQQIWDEHCHSLRATAGG
jgi:hypothetical protein